MPRKLSGLMEHPPLRFHPHFLFGEPQKKTAVKPSKEKTFPGGHRRAGDLADSNTTVPSHTGEAFRKLPNIIPRAALRGYRAKAEFDQLLFPRFSLR